MAPRQRQTDDPRPTRDHATRRAPEPPVTARGTIIAASLLISLLVLVVLIARLMG